MKHEQKRMATKTSLQSFSWKSIFLITLFVFVGAGGLTILSTKIPHTAVEGISTQTRLVPPTERPAPRITVLPTAAIPVCQIVKSFTVAYPCGSGMYLQAQYVCGDGTQLKPTGFGTCKTIAQWTAAINCTGHISCNKGIYPTPTPTPAFYCNAAKGIRCPGGYVCVNNTCITPTIR